MWPDHTKYAYLLSDKECYPMCEGLKVCDKATGKCKCPPGYEGANCESINFKDFFYWS